MIILGCIGLINICPVLIYFSCVLETLNYCHGLCYIPLDSAGLDSFLLFFKNNFPY